MQQVRETDTAMPMYRFELKGAIHSAGFRTAREFCEQNGFDEAQVSRVLNGWHLPSPRMQRDNIVTLEQVELRCELAELGLTDTDENIQMLQGIKTEIKEL